MKPKFITIINDCKSGNDIGRQESRFAVLFPGTHISFVGVESSLGIAATLEAGGNLVDVLDATEGCEGIVTVNVAPRGQIKEDGENGTRFSFFWYKKTLVVSTTKGYCLSLAKKLGIVKEVNVLETFDVLDFARRENLLDKKLRDYIVNSQFRSFDFVPRVARWIWENRQLPSQKMEIKDCPNVVWLVDSFGNAKTTIVKTDLPVSDRQPITLNIGNFNYYERLKLLPDGETAIYSGSSGISNKRFIEVATQNRPGSAAGKLNLKVGDKIVIIK